MTMSGPVPGLATTAVCGRISAHPALLAGIEMRVVRRADGGVGPCAGIGPHRGLRPDILPPHEIDADGDVEAVLEALRIGAEHHLVRLDEAGRADDAQRGAGF